MKTLIEILGIASGVVVIMHSVPVYAWFVNKVGGIKPFSCELCMCFWTYLSFSMVTHGWRHETLLESFICSFVGYLISLKFLKW